MNIKALITTFVLGSSSAAMAEPVVSASAHAWWSWGTPSAGVQPVRVISARDDRDRTVRDHRRPWVYDYRYTDSERDYPREFAPNPWPQRPTYPDSCEDPDNVHVGREVSAYTGPIFQIPQGRYYIRQNWTAVTEPTRIAEGREYIRTSAAGPVDRFLLKAVAGSTFIEQVSVGFANGDTQVFRGLNRALDGNNPTLQLDLKGRAREVARVVVYGTSAPHSAYQLMGM